jgi:AraC-like DNA-binding protein
MIIDLSRCSLKIRHEGIATYPRGSGYGPRLVYNFEFVWMLAGTALWQVEGQEIMAKPGTVLLARPGMRDSFRWDERRSTCHGYIHFDLVGEVPDHTAWPLIRTLPDEDIVRPLLRHVGWLLGQKEGALQAESALRLVLEAFLNSQLVSASEPASDLPPAVQRMLDAISLAITERASPSLDDLVRISGVSRSSLAVQVKAALDCTPMEVLRLLRLDRAAQLLTRTDLAVHEVADLVGFDDAFHFSRLFRAEFGHSPRDFRQGSLLGQICPEARGMARKVRALPRL